MGEMRNAHKLLFGKGKRKLCRPRSRWNYNTREIKKYRQFINFFF
jgi:hypothetical protein